MQITIRQLQQFSLLVLYERDHAYIHINQMTTEHYREAIRYYERKTGERLLQDTAWINMHGEGSWMTIVNDLKPEAIGIITKIAEDKTLLYNL